MYNEISNKMYNIIIGLVLLWGFAINVIMCIFFQDVFSTWNPSIVLIGYLVIALIGILMSEFSDDHIVSFIGYNLLVLPMGVVLSITLKDYYISSIIQAFVLTSIITIIMIVISGIKPEIFQSMGTTLFICLTGAFVIELFMPLAGITNPEWWDWLVALVFCGYIGYDWSRAQKKTKTLDNAVDSAVDLYLDIINLFVRLLGSKDDD